MAYSDFTLPEVTKRFQLVIRQQAGLFAYAPVVEPSALLAENLTENIPLAASIATEKARSELIIMPILVEVRRRLNHQVSLFSGVDFTVDASQGLNGVCDYLLSYSTEQLFIRAPVLAIVEAKNENIKGGFAQCIAAMVAAQVFNEREGNSLPMIYGVVTTGSIWRFLQLEGSVVTIDEAEYFLEQLATLLGILAAMVTQR